MEQLDRADAGYSVLFCDIERFKSVNDRRGHHVGDQLLVQVADRRPIAVGGDGLVARWGGDEFLVIADFLDDDGLPLMADRVAARLGRTPIILADGTTVPVTLTVGYAAHRPGDGRSIDSVLQAADRSMYEQRRLHYAARPRPADQGHAVP